MTDDWNLANDVVTRQHIDLFYHVFLNRAPESEATIQSYLKCRSLTELASRLGGSEEFAIRTSLPSRVSEDQIFRGYSQADLQVFAQFPRHLGPGESGFATNFLGVKVRTEFQAPLAPYDGLVESLPIPTGGLQGETAEFIGALRSVLDANDVYRVLECGAGYGPWMGITAAAARSRGTVALKLYGIEGDAEHVTFMQRHMNDCNLLPSEYTIIHGAIGAVSGIARWAMVENAAAVYGGRPLEGTNIDYFGDYQAHTVQIKVHGVNDLLARESEWDLVHLDIQGGEGEVCRAGIDEMTKRVRRVVVGTHSRSLDGEVMATFEAANWILENEKPTVMEWRPYASTLESMTRVDGAQVWRNPILLPLSIT